MRQQTKEAEEESLKILKRLRVETEKDEDYVFAKAPRKKVKIIEKWFSEILNDEYGLTEEEAEDLITRLNCEP